MLFAGFSETDQFWTLAENMASWEWYSTDSPITNWIMGHPKSGDKCAALVPIQDFNMASDDCTAMKKVLCVLV